MNFYSEQKHVYAVLGMARTGTSAITRGLQALGIDLGEKLVPANQQFNPKGVYEDREVVYDINRSVAFVLDVTWNSLQLMNHQCRDNPKLKNLQSAAEKLLKTRFTQTSHWGFKDPRTSKILSFWQEVFAKQQLQDHYVIALRNPLASAFSWQKLSKTDVEINLISWLIHLIAAIDGTEAKNRVLVSYELLLENPQLQLTRIKENLNIPDLAAENDLIIYSNQFLEKKLQHHTFNDDDLTHHDTIAVAPLCAKVFFLLMKVARDEISFESSAFVEGWREIKKEFFSVYPIYCFMDQLLKRNTELTRDLRSIQRSFSWKLIYPLRLVGDAWRQIRKKRRARRKISSA